MALLSSNMALILHQTVKNVELLSSITEILKLQGKERAPTNATDGICSTNPGHYRTAWIFQVRMHTQAVLK